MGLATFFQIAGLASDHWVDTVTDQYGTVAYTGLWRKCSDFGLARDVCSEFKWTDNQVSHWFRTVQTFEVLGFVFGSTSLLMMALFHFVETCQENGRLRIISILLLAVAFLMVIIGCIVIGALKDTLKGIEIESSAFLSWGFGVSIVASLLYLASCVAVAIS